MTDLLAYFGSAPSSATLGTPRRRVTDPRRLRLVKRGLARERTAAAPLKAHYLALHMAAAESKGTRLSPRDVGAQMPPIAVGLAGVICVFIGLGWWLNS